MLNTILLALVPIFFVLALGYCAGRARMVDNRNVADLNGLVMDVAVPVAIFVAVAQASRATLIGQLPLAGILSLSMLILYALIYGVVRYGLRVPTGEASVQALTASLPNYAAAGLPLIAALLGPEHVVAVATSIACGAIVVSPLTLVILEASAVSAEKRSIGLVLWHAFRKPIVLAPVVAVLYALSGIGLPVLAIKALTLIGQVAGGAALFLTGLVVSAQQVRVGSNAIISTLVSNIAHPLLTAGLAAAFALAPLTAREAILLSALPAGFFGALFGLRFGITSNAVGTTIFASTLLSALTLGATIYLTAGMS